MAIGSDAVSGSVEQFPRSTQTTALSDELNRMLAMLREACPEESHISFDFDGTLHLHIDVRNREDVAVIETTLPKLGLGVFHNISRGGTPHRPFFHRVTAVVDR